MPIYEVRLKPKGFVHSFPSSNTIFGAICWGVKSIYGEDKLEDLLNSFISNPPFLITSSSPLLQKDSFCIRFFPKPKLPIPKLDPQLFEEYKSFKKISFVSESLFLEILGGKEEEALLLEFCKGEIEKIDLGGEIEKIGDIALKKEESMILKEKPPLLKRLKMARNKIDRLICSSTGAGEFFYDFRLSFTPEISLFFLLKTEKIDLLKPVFKFLEDSGIGGDRTIGANHFHIEVKEARLDLPSEGRKLVTLSRWRVDPGELDMSRQGEFRYELLPWRGVIETGFDFKDRGIIWKSKTLYFAEGSVLVVKNESQGYYGSIWLSHEVGGKRIMDYGIAFPAFFKEK